MDGKLSDRAIRAWLKRAKAGEPVQRKLFDGGGLHLTLTERGTPVWRIKYRHGGTEGSYSAIGAFPDVGLKTARAERAKVKALLKAGRDPVQSRRLERAEAIAAAGQTFAEVARDWLANERKRRRWGPVHYAKSKRALERDVLPRLGKLPVKEITPAIVTGVVKAILRRGVRESAEKILQHTIGVFTFAMAHGLRDDNPALPARIVLPRPSAPVRHAALLTFNELGELLRRAEAARLSPVVHMAHRLIAFAPGSRVGNVVSAEWGEFALDADPPVWRIPRSKIKAQDRTHDHTIILGSTIAAELRAWRSAGSGKGPVFPGRERGTVSREAIEKMYRVTLAMKGAHRPHGWRSSFSTAAREAGFERDAIELALDHVHDSEVARSYDRGQRWEQRIKLARWWDEQLAQAQRGAEVKPLKRSA